jgi:nucleoside-diphosphate-sugar epimerase
VLGTEPALTPEMARQATRELTCDCSKAVRALGYRPVPLRDMARDCVAWLVAEGLIAAPAAPRP